MRHGVDRYSYYAGRYSDLPDWVGVGVVPTDGGDDSSWLLTLSDGHLIMGLRQDWAFIHIVDVDGDRCRGCRSVSASNKSHWVLSTEHKNVLALTLKVQDLRDHTDKGIQRQI